MALTVLAHDFVGDDRVHLVFDHGQLEILELQRFLQGTQVRADLEPGFAHIADPEPGMVGLAQQGQRFYSGADGIAGLGQLVQHDGVENDAGGPG